MPTVDPLLKAEAVSKSFGSGDSLVKVFESVDLTVLPGDFVAIMGPSGCGKSTLLHLLAGLDDPDSGVVAVEGRSWQGRSLEERARMRGETIGFVFQFHHLLPELSVEENVALPLLLAGWKEERALGEARECLDRVGMMPRHSAFPRTLSGGERQRTALARAVVRKPRLLLCDEPTGSLDAAHAAEVFELLTVVARERAGAVVVVTHDRAWARRCATMLHLAAGGLNPSVEDGPPGAPNGNPGPSGSR